MWPKKSDHLERKTLLFQVRNIFYFSNKTNIFFLGIYSPVKSEQEEKVAEILRHFLPDISLTLSHQIGHMGLLERENAAILNECLKPLCQRTITGLVKAVQDLGLYCPMFLTQNDGTLAR